MPRLIQVDENMQVKKAEAVVKARYKLNPLSLKFITVLISGLKFGDDQNEEYIFKVKDFKELAKLKRNDLHWAIKQALKELLEKPLEIKTDDGFIVCNWISGGHYVDTEGVIKFMIYPKLRPYLLEAKEKFLKYRLENILPLKSSYSIRLYENLKDIYKLRTKFGNVAEEIIKVSELREMLKVPRSYQYSSHIKKLILEKAKKELSEHTDIIFDYKEIKTGRKVTHLKFIIRKNPTKTEEYLDSKINYNLKSVRHFISFLRKNYVDKYFGYALVAQNICWLKINDKGLVYGVLDSGEKKHFNNIESERIYNNWWEVAKANWFYQKVILEDMRDFREFYNDDLDFRLNLKQTIEYLKEENLLK